MRICHGCGYAQYCDAACQRKDWRGHRAVCRPSQLPRLLASLPSYPQRDYTIRLPTMKEFVRTMHIRPVWETQDTQEEGDKVSTKTLHHAIKQNKAGDIFRLASQSRATGDEALRKVDVRRPTIITDVNLMTLFTNTPKRVEAALAKGAMDALAALPDLPPSLLVVLFNLSNTPEGARQLVDSPTLMFRVTRCLDTTLNLLYNRLLTVIYIVQNVFIHGFTLPVEVQDDLFPDLFAAMVRVLNAAPGPPNLVTAVFDMTMSLFNLFELWFMSGPPSSWDRRIIGLILAICRDYDANLPCGTIVRLYLHRQIIADPADVRELQCAKGLVVAAVKRILALPDEDVNLDLILAVPSLCKCAADLLVYHRFDGGTATRWRLTLIMCVMFHEGGHRAMRACPALLADVALCQAKFAEARFITRWARRPHDEVVESFCEWATMECPLLNTLFDVHV